MARVYIETYGCALNRADSSLIKEVLRSRGHTIVRSINEAEVVIINTCTVRLDTELRIIKRLRRLRRALLGKGVKVVIAGCMVSAQPYTLSKVFPEASMISPQNILRVWEAVESPNRVLLIDGVRDTRCLPLGIEGRIAIVPIAEGCLGNCSYCITRIARSRLRSYPPNLIINSIKKAVARGVIEIDLTAQDTASYGLDLEGGIRLPDLINKIVDSISGNYMIRVGMANPDTLASIIDEFIEVMKHPNIYKCVHIPLQSGDDRVLRIMRRRYTYDEFKSLIKEIRRKIPEALIATDIIVGHPGEDDEAFNNTLRAVKELMFDKVHIAQYTKRPRTPAASMPQVPEGIKKARSSALVKLVEEIGKTINSSYIGSIALAYVTHRSFRGSVIARLVNYKPVVIMNDDVGDTVINYRRVYVTINSSTFYDLRGNINKAVE